MNDPKVQPICTGNPSLELRGEGVRIRTLMFSTLETQPLASPSNIADHCREPLVTGVYAHNPGLHAGSQSTRCQVSIRYIPYYMPSFNVRYH